MIMSQSISLKKISLKFKGQTATVFDKTANYLLSMIRRLPVVKLSIPTGLLMTFLLYTLILLSRFSLTCGKEKTT